MGEIDRIQPLFRPVMGPRPADRVQPGSERHHQSQQDRDELDLHNAQAPEETEENAAEPEALDPPRSGDGLDISI